MLTGTGRWTLVLAAASVVVGVLGRYPSLTAVGIGLLVVVALASITLLGRPELRVDQVLTPATIAAGEAGTAAVTITNLSGRRSPAMLVSDQIGQDRLFEHVEPLGAGRTRTIQLHLPTARRGVFDVGPVTVGRADPLGLFRVDLSQGVVRRLTVHPPIEAIPPLPTGHRREVEGAVSTEPIEGGISFHSLREYREGDDLRLVHWRSVARTGQMMVRRNIIATEPRLMVLLDTSAASYHDPDQFEEAVAVAASLVNAGARSRYPLSFRTTGGLGADISPVGEGLATAMRILAEAQPADTDRGLNQVLLLAEEGAGVSLGAVTGTPRPAETVGVSKVRSRFDMVTVAQITSDGDAPRIPGVDLVRGVDRHDVYRHWKARFS